jgi:hypothetical protein
MLYAVWGSGRADVWAVGERGNGPLLFHFDGAAWGASTTPLPGGTPGLLAVWGNGNDDVWAAGGSTGVHFDGSVRSTIAIAGATAIHGLWGSGKKDVWAVDASGAIFRGDGSGWSQFPSPSSLGLRPVSVTSPQSGWAVGESGTILKLGP